MSIIAALCALLTSARSPQSGGRVLHSAPTSATRTDDAELLAVASAMGVVRDLSSAAAAPALALAGTR